MITLTFLPSVAIAHGAKPGLELTEAAARAGDLVHFSISGVDGSVSYTLKVSGAQVLEGHGDDVVSGTFTAPDLGDSARTVTVEAKVRGSGKRKTLWSELEYVGSALPVTDPPAQTSPPAAPVVPQAAPSPEPSYAPNVVERTSSAPAAKPKPKHRRRQTRKRHAIEPRRHVARNGEHRPRARRGRHRRKHDSTTRNRSKRRARPTAPPFDGIPEPGRRGQQLGPERAAPRPAVLVASGARPRDAGGAHAAIVVPALLGLAALALAGTAVMRRRRLASRSRRN